MTTYTINVTNNSSTPQSYLLFIELPQITAAGPMSPFSNVYAIAPETQNDGSLTTFAFTTTAFACCGTQDIGPNVVVNTRDNTQMTLAGGSGQNVANMVIVNGGPGFTTSTSGASAGSFNITVPPYDPIRFRE